MGIVAKLQTDTVSPTFLRQGQTTEKKLKEICLLHYILCVDQDKRPELSDAKIADTHEQKMTKEIRCKDFLQAIRGDIVLLSQNPLTGGKHGDDIATGHHGKQISEVSNVTIDMCAV